MISQLNANAAFFQKLHFSGIVTLFKNTKILVHFYYTSRDAFRKVLVLVNVQHSYLQRY